MIQPKNEYDELRGGLTRAFMAMALLGFVAGAITGSATTYYVLRGMPKADAAPSCNILFTTESKEMQIVADGNGDGQDAIVLVAHGRLYVKNAGDFAKLQPGKKQQVTVNGDTIIKVKP